MLPGGTLALATSLVGSPAFPLKLAFHCVNPFEPNGVMPIPPAVQSGPGDSIFTFPVTGGSIAPDFSSGRVISAAGQKLTKNVDSISPGPPVVNCSGFPDLETSVLQTEWEAEFDVRALATNTVFPSGPVGIAALGPFDLAKAKTSADPNTRQVTVSGAPVTMDFLSALVLNQVFPNATDDPANDFKEGDLLGQMTLSVTTH